MLFSITRPKAVLLYAPGAGYFRRTLEVVMSKKKAKRVSVHPLQVEVEGLKGTQEAVIKDLKNLFDSREGFQNAVIKDLNGVLRRVAFLEKRAIPERLQEAINKLVEIDNLNGIDVHPCADDETFSQVFGSLAVLSEFAVKQ
jgi:hypothetical protein